MEKKTLKSFQTLEQKHHLGKQDQFRYFQVRDHYLGEIERKKANTEPNEIIQLVVQPYSSISKSIVSKLYKGIAKTRGNTTNYIKERWERELGETISNQQWKNMCESVFTTSCSM